MCLTNVVYIGETRMYTIFDRVVTDSKGNSYNFKMCENHGGYYFLWNDVKLDWSFSPKGFYQAKGHYDIICDDVNEIDYMVNWVKEI